MRNDTIHQYLIISFWILMLVLATYLARAISRIILRRPISAQPLDLKIALYFWGYYFIALLIESIQGLRVGGEGGWGFLIFAFPSSLLATFLPIWWPLSMVIAIVLNSALLAWIVRRMSKLVIQVVQKDLGSKREG